MDQDPYKQGIKEKVENVNVDEADDEFKQINKKVKIDVSKEDFDKIQDNNNDEMKIEKISHGQLCQLAEKLINLLENEQTPNNLIKKLRPATVQKQHLYKKNIRKNDKSNKNNEKSMTEEENDEKKEKFHEIIDICDTLTSNGCLGIFQIILNVYLLIFLEIYSQTKEEITEFLNEKLKKNIGIEQHLINSDEENKNEGDDSESDEEVDKIFREIKEKAKEID